MNDGRKLCPGLSRAAAMTAQRPRYRAWFGGTVSLPVVMPSDVVYNGVSVVEYPALPVEYPSVSVGERVVKADPVL
jgi:hypothetical protein